MAIMELDFTYNNIKKKISVRFIQGFFFLIRFKTPNLAVKQILNISSTRIWNAILVTILKSNAKFSILSLKTNKLGKKYVLESYEPNGYNGVEFHLKQYQEKNIS